MKFRSRVAAIAAAAGLAASLVFIGGAGTAHAATIGIDCDQVVGTGKIKPNITNVQALSTASIATPDGFTRNCTGALAATAGPLTKVKGKLVGDASCNTSAPPSANPLNGKVTMTYTNLDAKFKPLASSTYIRVGFAGSPDPADALNISNGIVTKGVGVGYDVVGKILFHPTDLKNATVVADGNSTINGATVNPGLGSLELGVNCQLGVVFPGVPTSFGTIVWGTDGNSLSTVATPPVAGALDSSLSLQLP